MQASNDKAEILSTNLFPVIGVGASAGGLSAFKTFVKAIPPDSGMAYVLVQHLAPDHESLLPEILQKFAQVPVVEISDDIKVQPDHIYILPSNKMLVANDGVLQLTPRAEKTKSTRNLPIDLFFTSLANIHQTHSIGIVLSGTGSDGTHGLKAIKDQGGITFAQELSTAEYDGMPHHAIEAGVVDFILAPGEMTKKLLELKNQLIRTDEEIINLPKQDDEVFKQILSFLHVRKGTDFAYYKQTTLRRRILRRMALNKNESPAQYYNFLKENKSEPTALYLDLLIPVTSFFRDEKVFNNLCNAIFPHILNNKFTEEPIRIWVAGCSTGQEAYSMAICLKESLGDNPARVQVFATDVSEPAVAKARTGLYSKAEIEDVSSGRLKEFFIKADGGYQLNKQIRSMCVFATHDFLKDPPFGRMDLVSCRNVLIYMEPYLQKKALTTFHYALNTKGFLLLGKSETCSSVPELFNPSEKQDKLFTRKDVAGRFMMVTSRKNEQTLDDSSNKILNENIGTDFQKSADEIMLNKYTPAGVVVNEAMDIVYFRGNSNLYLEQAPGKPSHNLLKMARVGLAFELRNLLHKVKKEKSSVTKDNIHFQSGNNQYYISIEAVPLPNMVEPHYLVIFNPADDFKNSTGLVTGPNDRTSSRLKNEEKKDQRIQRLEKELMQIHEDMRSITEDQEAVNEELQSANEELLSSSEELQSLNEELESSKEELQSTNEELTVLNQELLSSNEQLNISREYAEAIIATLPEPLLVLNKNLRVIKANGAFFNSFGLTEKQTESALIYELGDEEWNIPALRELLEEILPEKTEFENFEVTHQFRGIGERIMLLNAREIVRKAGEDKLILLVIRDITQRKKMERKEIEIQKRYAGELEEKVRQRTLELVDANKQLEQKYVEVKGMNAELEAFTYISSHDLQEPLRKIQSFTQRILQKEFAGLSENGKEYFSIINHAATTMRTLIGDLLVYSRMTTTERVFEKTDIAEIVEEVKFEYAEIISEKKAVIKIVGDSFANINRFQFRQLLNNLLGNALKFSRPAVPPEITITNSISDASDLEKDNADLAGLLVAGEKYYHISVKDNGIGFNKKYKNQIFDIFQRLHGKEEFEGTGIGLAIAKKIVDNHSGFITATAVENKGSCFDIYIPQNKI
ncbi:MAG: CheR family methyltransferase [Ferruginibacter sp.]